MPDIASTVVAKVINGKDIREVIRLGIEKVLCTNEVHDLFNLYHAIVEKAGQIPELIKVNPKE